ncbi:hypothetical protein GCM10010245_27370 [Streptomyces spectabilis]|uniref:Uncharacterized protein n=1 Tax=Streptomyces spectabilis TaxID=68270 RepID=A0A5P2X8P9_STRST|nr:hypothetical protein [Streptomyces spectabilis]QEV59515.1 hypothetical protein CP982_12865 [Streptomyces spectabilis]GGV15833.1 hypothetical protein GCM10010245_27370 [Streptomyces spectabilis]
MSATGLPAGPWAGAGRAFGATGAERVSRATGGRLLAPRAGLPGLDGSGRFTLPGLLAGVSFRVRGVG